MGLTSQFRNVVIDHESDNSHDEDKAEPEGGFLHAQAKIAPHEHFHQQHKDGRAVQDRNGQQVDHREIQAEAGHQTQERNSPLAGFLTRYLYDANGTGHRFRRHAPLGYTTQELIDEGGVLDVFANGFGQRLWKRQADEHYYLLQTNADHPLLGAAAFGHAGRQVCGDELAIAREDDVHRLAAIAADNVVDVGSRVDRLAVHAYNDVSWIESGFSGGRVA